MTFHINRENNAYAKWEIIHDNFLIEFMNLFQVADIFQHVWYF